ncbi:hypothetical protein BB558_005109 [Smittium angustum]|uniref:Uncharacterized protein n=1 Tax=Smittium angustum TaxID=133377 RepID=A0A2U1J1N3_SMIAN|nr:hypothetical protein BB558_005109 [Smittium angustum]
MFLSRQNSVDLYLSLVQSRNSWKSLLESLPQLPKTPSWLTISLSSVFLGPHIYKNVSFYKKDNSDLAFSFPQQKDLLYLLPPDLTGITIPQENETKLAISFTIKLPPTTQIPSDTEQNTNQPIPDKYFPVSMRIDSPSSELIDIIKTTSNNPTTISTRKERSQYIIHHDQKLYSNDFQLLRNHKSSLCLLHNQEYP